MSDKFTVDIPGMWQAPWPAYFNKFYHYCEEIARANDWLVDTVINHQLKPLGGRLIKTSTQGWYLRWDQEESHTVFVLRWS